VLRVAIPRDATCGAVARRQLEGYLDGFPGEVVSDAKSVASELVNNAYRHGEGAIQLAIQRHEHRVRIEVGDEGPTGAARVQRGKGRRGLEIVEGLSAQWGAYAGSTHVWAELDLPARKPRLAGTPEKGT
jgi:anti-sigma regulatory factor (Ser/Thr protein kinase)